MSLGEYHILEHPKPGILYGCGIDPIPTDPNEREIKLSRDDRSSHVACILKFEPEPMPVAYYRIQSGDAWVIHDETTRLQMYYNNAKAMIERNRGSVLLTRYVDSGHFNGLLAPWPYAAIVPGWEKIKIDSAFRKKANEKGWFNAATYTKPAFDCVVEFLTNYSHTIWFEELIDEIEQYHVKNCDIFDAFMSAVIYYYHWKRTAFRKYEKQEAIQHSYYTMENGRQVLKKATIQQGSRGHTGFEGTNLR